MRLLWVATKAPWPPVDGGRLLLHNTLRALEAAGHEVTLVAPVDPRASELGRVREALAPLCTPRLVPLAPRSAPAAALAALLGGRPWTLVRHDRAALRRRVATALAEGDHDLVVAEQLQALAACRPALQASRPVVLRAQNVESDLWRASAELAGPAGLAGFAKPLLRREARRLARAEGAAVRAAAATAAMTPEDAERLRRLAGEGFEAGEVHVVPAPFETHLPPAAERLEGAPAVVLLGSGGWRPNRAGAEWLLREVWPRLRAELAAARLHVFGLGEGVAAEGVVAHPAPAASRGAFAPGSLLAVPLQVASGVRMKVLEAWARGVPVVATSAAARGLGAEAGRELEVADDPEAFAAALARLHREPERSREMVAAGRRKLREKHAFERVAAGLETVWRRALGPA